MCTGTICQLATCADGVLNQDETDTDCGGASCAACGDGLSCLAPGDCTSGVCTGTICQVATCSDSIQNQDETGVDCGGVSCPACGGPTITQLVSGSGHVCVLLSSGNVRCWGQGLSGRLGYGNLNNIGDDETPASAGDVDVGGTVIQITAGGAHTCALLDTGNVRCWGYAAQGQLGYANSQDIGDNELPASAGDVNVGGTVVQISAGRFHTCARLDTGAVRCWGEGNFGQLGYGNTARIGDNETPASAGDVDVGGTVSEISAGSSNTCARLSTGTVRCWGYGASGSLGYGNTNNIGDNETPAFAGDVTVGTTVSQVVVGQYTCVVTSSNSVRCWGASGLGQLGYPGATLIGDDETPASVGDVTVGSSVTEVRAGLYHTCAVTTTGTVRCWGRGNVGQLGYGNTNNIGDDETPASAGDVNVGGTVTQVAVGGLSSCVLLDTGNVRCWGDGSLGTLGYGNTNTLGDDETPASAGDVTVF
ncbi:MAG: hypothetical protein IPJ88_06870 [Myxococcales bacterium]|nr:MAG: hypothetical protein IPJ88_06870 [Myxococcales bacterium]